MSSSAIVTAGGESDLLEVSKRFLVTVVFQTSKSPSYPIAVSLAVNADLYSETVQGKLTLHVAAFNSRPDGVSRALSLMRLVRSLTGTFLFAKGQLLRRDSNIDSVLECYLESLKFENPDAHCSRLYPSQFPLGIAGQHIKIEGVTPGKKAVLPCSKVCNHLGWSLVMQHPASLAEQFRAVCVEKGTDICPRCKPENFRLVP